MTDTQIARRKKRLEKLGWTFPRPDPSEIITQSISGHTIVNQVNPARHYGEKHGALGFISRMATSEVALLEQLEALEQEWANRGIVDKKPNVVDGPTNSGAAS